MASSDCVALIPLRGGSKSIKYKNIKPFLNEPLCYWTLKAACNAETIDKVFVSTDSEKIRETVNSFDLDLSVIDRPDHLASDTASTESVMLHFSDSYEFKTMVTIQATSPLLETEDLDCAINKFNEEGFDSLFSAVRTKRFFWNEENIEPINYNFMKRPRRQDFKGLLMENGSFYITSKDVLNSSGSRLGGSIGYYEMSDEHAVELDEPLDWIILEQIAKNRFIS